MLAEHIFKKIKLTQVLHKVRFFQPVLASLSTKKLNSLPNIPKIWCGLHEQILEVSETFWAHQSFPGQSNFCSFYFHFLKYAKIDCNVYCKYNNILGGAVLIRLQIP